MGLLGRGADWGGPAFYLLSLPSFLSLSSVLPWPHVCVLWHEEVSAPCWSSLLHSHRTRPPSQGPQSGLTA